MRGQNADTQKNADATAESRRELGSCATPERGGEDPCVTGGLADARRGNRGINHISCEVSLKRNGECLKPVRVLCGEYGHDKPIIDWDNGRSPHIRYNGDKSKHLSWVCHRFQWLLQLLDRNDKSLSARRLFENPYSPIAESGVLV